MTEVLGDDSVKLLHGLLQMTTGIADALDGIDPWGAGLDADGQRTLAEVSDRAEAISSLLLELMRGAGPDLLRALDELDSRT